MAYDVLRSRQVAQTARQQMDRRSRASYEAAHDDLCGRGCVAGGYRLAAVDGDDYPLLDGRRRRPVAL
jgi:hypothetical protein